MTPREAANAISSTVVFDAGEPALTHRSKFISDVAAELDVAPTFENLNAISKALTKAKINVEVPEYPRMFYGLKPSPSELDLVNTYHARGEFFSVIVESDEQRKKLGAAWTESPDDLRPDGADPKSGVSLGKKRKRND